MLGAAIEWSRNLEEAPSPAIDVAEVARQKMAFMGGCWQMIRRGSCGCRRQGRRWSLNEASNAPRYCVAEVFPTT